MNILQEYSAWVHALPMGGQMIVAAFWWSMVFWGPLAVLDRRMGWDRGAARPKGWQVGVIVVPFLFYLRYYTVKGREVLDWPNHHIPHFDAYWWAMLVGFLLAGGVAKQVAKIIRPRTSKITRPASGYGVIGWTHRRTFHVFEED